MKNINKVNNLQELLDTLRTQETPMFVSLCARCGNENFLMDQVLHNMQEKYGENLGYQKVPDTASRIIKNELMISKNPVLLLINRGEIKAVFGGIVAQYKLEQALAALSETTALNDNY
ncbi:MAG: hypothetical protein AAF960_24285 [Bacteroidota bacterium]